jgi:protein SCO1/2
MNAMRVMVAIVSVLSALVVAPRAHAQPAGFTPPELQHVGVREHLEGQLPLDTVFRDHTGKQVKLRDYFDGVHPVVLTFAYHSCPVLCGMVLNNEADGLKEIGWSIGKEYRAVTISIDPEDPLDRTQAKRKSILYEYGRPGTEDWTFLLGDAIAIKQVADAAGFEYQYDERQKQWGHPSVVMIVTPDGKMARYLYGLEFPPNDLRLGLIEAKKGKSISTVEQIIMYCYHYDPQGGKYVLVANRVMQVGAGGMALILFGVLGSLWARELKRARANKKKKNDENDERPAEEAAAV